MSNILNWKLGGLFLATIFLATVVLVKPIGVSTQYVITDAFVLSKVNPDLIKKDGNNYSSTNSYLNKSKGKYAKNASNPINYSFVFVLAMMLGGFISSKLKGDRPENKEEAAVPEVWRESFCTNHYRRYLAAFIGGFLVLFGARLAGGCTSGHMMSGIMQTSLSGYIFAASVFAAAIPAALLLFNNKPKTCCIFKGGEK